MGVKRSTPLHPKTMELARALGCRRPEAVGTLEMLWHFAAQFAPAGDIGRHTDLAIEEACDWGGTPGALVAQLVACRWLDAHPTYRLVVHDWHTHADQAVHKLLARRGESFVMRRRGKRKAAGHVPDMSGLARGKGKGSSLHGSEGEKEHEREGEGLTVNMRADAVAIACKNPDACFRQCRDYHASKGSRIKSWPAAWRNWLLRHGSFGIAACDRVVAVPVLHADPAALAEAKRAIAAINERAAARLKAVP